MSDQPSGPKAVEIWWGHEDHMCCGIEVPDGPGDGYEPYVEHSAYQALVDINQELRDTLKHDVDKIEAQYSAQLAAVTAELARAKSLDLTAAVLAKDMKDIERLEAELAAAQVLATLRTEEEKDRITENHKLRAELAEAKKSYDLLHGPPYEDDTHTALRMKVEGLTRANEILYDAVSEVIRNSHDIIAKKRCSNALAAAAEKLK